jgi:hypothetical protein
MLAVLAILVEVQVLVVMAAMELLEVFQEELVAQAALVFLVEELHLDQSAMHLAVAAAVVGS